MRLPAPPKSDPARPWQVLPNLKDLKEAIYCDASAPSLTPSFSTWEEDMLLTVLSSAGSALLKDTDLKYLVEFLEMEQRRYIVIHRIQMEIRNLLQVALRSIPISTFRGIRAAFQSLVALLQPEYRIAIGARKTTSGSSLDESILKLLINCETNLLLLPYDLDPTGKDSESCGQPNDLDIEKWIVAIDKEVRHCISDTNGNDVSSQSQVKHLLNAASALLEMCGPKDVAKARVIRLHRDALILTAIDARTETENAIDFNSLLRAHEQGLLFKQGDFQTKTGHVKQLASALKRSDIWVVSAEIAKYVESDGRTRVPSASDGKAILMALGKADKPYELNEVEHRRELIKLVHGEADGNCQPSCRLNTCDYAAILSSNSPSISSSFAAIC